MERKNILQVNVSNLIALCHIIEDFEQFDHNLINLMTKENNSNLVIKLGKISRGELSFCSRAIKKFYQNNRAVIDMINKYSSIEMFLFMNYNEIFGTPIYGGIHAVYPYILQNKKELPQILMVLEKIRKLGFEELNFDENLDFTKEEYTMNVFLGNNGNVSYLDHIEVMPNYEYDMVRYRTTSSNYKIVLGISGTTSITVNSLLFDPKKLPDHIKKEEIFDKILKLKGEQKEACVILKGIVDLRVGIDNISQQFMNMHQMAESLEDVDSKKELLQVLVAIKEKVYQLEMLNLQYQHAVLEQNPAITEDVIKKEKIRYLRRRDNDSIDFC